MPQFINRNKNVHFSCEEIVAPASVDEVVALVDRARANGRRIKAVGGAHGFNNDIKTDGILVDLGRMNRVLSVDRQKNTAIVEASITLADAIAALDAASLHFPSLGSWSGQTIAGAIGTSTHGSTLRHGTLSDIITGVEVVLSDGSVVWISEGDRLRALRVHLGQLGLITKVELACVSTFFLGCSIREVSEEEGFTEISRLAREHEYISMLWLPYLEQCSIRILSHSTAPSRNELAAQRAREATEISRLGKTLVDVGQFLAGHAYLRAPRFLAKTYSRLIRTIFHEDDGVVDKSYNVFRYDKYREPNTNHYLRLILNSEYALDIQDLETALAVQER